MRSELGLSAHQLATLRQSLTEVIHCAADTRFDRPLEDSRRVNVLGTGNLLRLAQQCARITKFLHVSTVYVAGRCAGRIPEAALTHSARFSNSYQQSKYEAEDLVRSCSGSLPVAIARISSIIGESGTGRVRQFNHIHQLLKLFPQCAIPMAPYDPAASVDVVPSDWVAEALTRLFQDHFASGAVYHLCASDTENFTVEEMLAETHRLFALHPSGAKWLPIRLPKLVPLAEYEEWSLRARREEKPLLMELIRVLGYYLPHLGLRQVFENSATMRMLESAPALPPIRDTFASVVRWCLDTDWGKRDSE